MQVAPTEQCIRCMEYDVSVLCVCCGWGVCVCVCRTEGTCTQVHKARMDSVCMYVRCLTHCWRSCITHRGTCDMYMCTHTHTRAHTHCVHLDYKYCLALLPCASRVSEYGRQPLPPAVDLGPLGAGMLG